MKSAAVVLLGGVRRRSWRWWGRRLNSQWVRSWGCGMVYRGLQPGGEAGPM